MPSERKEFESNEENNGRNNTGSSSNVSDLSGDPIIEYPEHDKKKKSFPWKYVALAAAGVLLIVGSVFVPFPLGLIPLIAGAVCLGIGLGRLIARAIDDEAISQIPVTKQQMKEYTHQLQLKVDSNDIANSVVNVLKDSKGNFTSSWNVFSSKPSETQARKAIEKEVLHYCEANLGKATPNLMQLTSDEKDRIKEDIVNLYRTHNADKKINFKEFREALRSDMATRYTQLGHEPYYYTLEEKQEMAEARREGETIARGVSDPDIERLLRAEEQKASAVPLPPATFLAQVQQGAPLTRLPIQGEVGVSAPLPPPAVVNDPMPAPTGGNHAEWHPSGAYSSPQHSEIPQTVVVPAASTGKLPIAGEHSRSVATSPSAIRASSQESGLGLVS